MPTQHSVQQGDCLSSIAAQYGLSWQKIWNSGDNADLKKLRQDPNVLFPGDVVNIPDAAPKQQGCATDQRHIFKTKRAPTRIKIRLTIDDQARPNLPYQLEVAGQTTTGSTDGDGSLEADIPADAQSGVLTVGSDDPKEVYQLALGTLDPIDTDDGVKKRLASLGFEVEQDLPGAIQAFQTNNGMEANGTVDDALRQKLKERFGQ